jgi:hypothetical protein
MQVLYFSIVLQQKVSTTVYNQTPYHLSKAVSGDVALCRNVCYGVCF